MYFRARYLSRKLHGANGVQYFLKDDGNSFLHAFKFYQEISSWGFSNFCINESKIRGNAGSKNLCYFFEKFRCASRKKPTPLCSGPLLSHEWGKAATMTNEEYTKNEGAHIGTVSRRI